MTPPLATTLPYHLALRLWRASKAPHPISAIDAEVHAIKQTYPRYFKETS